MTEVIAWIAFLGMLVLAAMLYREIDFRHAMEKVFTNELEKLRLDVRSLTREAHDKRMDAMHFCVEERPAKMGSIFRLEERIDKLAKAAGYYWENPRTQEGRYTKDTQCDAPPPHVFVGTPKKVQK